MGVSYQTRNRLRRKVQTAPLTAPAPLAAPEAPVAAPARPGFTWWPFVAAAGVAVSAFAFVYRG